MNQNRQILDDSPDLSTGPGIRSLAEALLNDYDVQSRLQAAIELVRSGDSASVEILAKAANDENPTFRAKLVKAISKLKHHMATEILIKAMYDADCYVRKSAVEAVRDLDNPEIVKAIISCLNDEEINVRESAVIALEKSSNAGLVVGALVQAMEDSNWNVRRESVEALAKIGGSSSIAPLKKMLNDEDPEVRRSALLGLTGLIGPDSLEYAVEALADNGISVQLEAIHTIGLFGTTAMIPNLEAVATCMESSHMVRRAAFEAIKLIKEHEPAADE